MSNDPDPRAGPPDPLPPGPAERYEPVDVDAFVDKVEATLSQLTEENATLKQQVDALSSSEPSSIFVPGDSAEADQLKSDLRGRQAELEGAKGELAGKLEELGQRTQELEQARSELASAQAELDALRGQVAQLQQQAAAPQEAPSTPLGKVENIVVTSSAEASPAVTRLLQMATEQAERLVGESQVEASASCPPRAPRRRASSTTPTRRPTRP